MDLKLNGQTALVTGSSAGIGLAIATSLAREGATVAVNGRTADSAARGIEQIRQTVPQADLIPLAADCGTAAGCEAAIRQFPEVTILVNNLGIYEASDFFETSDDAWRRMFEVNILSGVRLSRHYLRQMLARRYGRIVFIASESAISPAPEMAHYSATKTMQLSISRSLAELTRGTAVTVNAVLPGSTSTDGVKAFIQQVFPGMDPAAAGERFMTENRPASIIRRLIEPREIGDFVAFVCSPCASAINGASLRVDGGLVRTIC